MANSIGPNANHSIRPRLAELNNVMAEDQHQKLSENMQAVAPKYTSKERRSVPRVNVQWPVYIEGIPGQQTITDLSIGGAFIECDSACRNKFRRGELIRLDIKLFTYDDVFQVPAQIVHISNRGMHCQFRHLDRRTVFAIYYCLNMGYC
jgi:hypothetical protein